MLIFAWFTSFCRFESYFDFAAILESSENGDILANEMEEQTIAKLHQILTPFLLRRLKADVELQIPPKREILVYAPMTQKQIDYYKAAVENSILKLCEETKEEEDRSSHDGRFMRTRKPVNYCENDTKNAKLDEMDEAWWNYMNSMVVSVTKQELSK